MESPPMLCAPFPVLSNEGSVAERLPWEVLELICNNSGDINPDGEELVWQVANRRFGSHPVPLPEYEASLASIDMPSDCQMRTEVPSRKLQKNKFVLSMSHVCHSWRVHLLGLKRLWREIAFSVQNKPTGVRLSTLFLARVKDSDVPLRIYAGLPFGDRQDPTIIDLLLKLRVHTDRWETFQYCGRLGPYNPYLDLPAPKLQYFSDHHDLSHLYSQKTTPLFAGYAPNLRSLTTSFLEGWQPATLANLRVLDLWDCKAEFSIGSLLSVLRNTPQLEEINITSPSPIHDCPPSQVVPLHNLKNLQVKNPDFYSIIGHLTIPNVRIATVSSVYNRGISGVPVRPAFEAVHPFVGLASMAARLPMITEPITLVSLDIQVTSSGFTFTISICTENNRILHVDLEWTGGVEILGWVRYIQRSISALAEMCFLPGASLQVTVPTDGFPINYNNPLFRLSTIEHLTVEGEKLPKVLKVLGSCRPLLLPHLKTLVVPEEELSEKTILSIPKFLQLRRNLAVALDTDNHMNLLRLLNRICSIEVRMTIVPNLGVHPLVYVRMKDSRLVFNDLHGF